MFSLSSGLKLLVAASLAATPTVSMSQACQGAGCVLPLGPPPVAAPPVEVVTPPAAPVEIIPEAVAGKGKGFSILPLILGAALIAALIYFLTQKDKDEDEEQPSSP